MEKLCDKQVLFQRKCKRHRLTIALFAGFLSLTFPREAVCAPDISLRVGMCWGLSGETVTIPVCLAVADDHPAVVFAEMVFDASSLEMIDVVRESATVSAGKNVAFWTPESGRLQIIVGGLNQTALSDGMLFSVEFHVLQSSLGVTNVRVTKVSAASPNAQRLVSETMNGGVEVVAALGLGGILPLVCGLFGIGILACIYLRRRYARPSALRGLLFFLLLVSVGREVQAIQPLAGDLTGDSIVNAEDLQRLADSVLGGSSCPGADVDFSGEVDAVDYQLVVCAVLGESIDSDSDGLFDVAESQLGTDPDLADTDGDGMNDGEELSNGTDPLGLTPPSAVSDPGRSIWIEFTDPVKSHGLTVSTAETVALPVVVDGRQSWNTPFLDLIVAPWFTASDVMLTVEYYDCGVGQVHVTYDSLDLTQLLEPNFPGAWKFAEPIICTGTNTWRQVQLHLPDARFAQMDNAADIRFWQGFVGDFPVTAIWISPVTAEPAMTAYRTVEIMNLDGSVASSHEPAADERYTLSTAQYELVFDVRGLFSILDKTTGIRPAHPGPNRSIAEFRTQKNPLYYATVQFVTSDVPVRMRVFGGETPTAIEYEWGFQESFHASCRIEKTDDHSTSRWQLDMGDRSESPPRLIMAKFPSLHGVAIDGNPTDDWFVSPCYAFHGSGIWHDLTTISTNPPSMAMNWLAVYDSSSGFGLFLDDPDALDTFSPVEQETDSIKMGLGFCEPLTNQQTIYLQIPVTHWHSVADLYRERVAASVPALQNPAWVSDCDGWDAWVANEIERGFSFIPAYFQQTVLPRGLPLMDVYRAMYDGPWCYCGVYPYPNAYYGTVEELKDANLRVRDHGGRTIYYINCQLSMPDGPDVKRIGPASRSFIPSHIPPPYAGQHGWTLTGRSYTGLPSEQVIMDRSARSWSDRNLYWGKWYTEQLAVDGIYWDQLSCAWGGLRETVWNLERITSECRALNPNFITAGEGVNYAHGRTLTMGLASAVFHHTELYRYTFPDHLVIDGTGNSATRWAGGDLRFNVIHLDGCRLDNLPSDSTFRENTLALRKSIKQILYQARFRDTEGITLTLPSSEPPYPVTSGPQLVFPGGIQAKRFVLNTVDSALVLVNTVNERSAPGAEVKVDVSEVAPIRSAWAFLWGGDLQQIPFSTLSADMVSFEVPTTMQATVVLVNRCEPLLYPETLPMAAAGTNVATRGSVLNLGSESMSGTVRWEVPAGWSATTAVIPTIDVGQSAQVNTSIAIGSDATRQVYDLECVAETSLGKGSRYVGAPVVPSPYVEWTWLAGEQFEVTLRNLTSVSATATVEVVLPSPCVATVSPPSHTIGITGNSEMTVDFTIGETGAMQEPVPMHLIVTSGENTQDIPIRLFPPVSNGAFEIDLAGDGKPEYWTTYDYSGDRDLSVLYPLISLDADRAHGGMKSLRIDPDPEGPGHPFKVVPLASMLFPDTDYRITCYVYVPPGGTVQIFDYSSRPLQNSGVPDSNGWQKRELVFRTGDEAYRSLWWIDNQGTTAVWVDDVVLTPL